MNGDLRNTQKIWDAPTRIFHWALVVLILAQYLSGQFELLPMSWHYWLGYTTLALAVFRVMWGFAGSSSARFAQFLRGPRVSLRYARSLMHGEPDEYPGHNPLGGWSALAMLLSILVQAGSGLFASDDIFEAGPLVDRVSGRFVSLMTWIHDLNRWMLVALIALHLGAVLYHAIGLGENLVGAMWHGRKRSVTGEVRFAPWWRAVMLFAIAAAAVTALVWFGVGSGSAGGGFGD